MTDIQQLARDLEMNPLDIIRDLGEREAMMLAKMYTRIEDASTMKPTQFLPLRNSRGNEFGTVAASIPEDLFGHLLTCRGKGYDLMGRLDARDLREVVDEFPICATETVSGKVMSGWTPPANKGKRGGVRFDSTVKISLAK